jgi:hypothetical protein
LRLRRYMKKQRIALRRRGTSDFTAQHSLHCCAVDRLRSVTAQFIEKGPPESVLSLTGQNIRRRPSDLRTPASVRLEAMWATPCVEDAETMARVLSNFPEHDFESRLPPAHRHTE